MPRDISTLGFPATVRQKLLRAGYSDDGCFKNATPLNLARATRLTNNEALQVIKVVTESNTAKPEIQEISAYSLALTEASTVGIVTFSQKIDSMFGEGIPLGKITEICGVPGIGKTQFGMQVCVDASIPECFGGVQGEAIFIDTEGSFVAERVLQMAEATVNHCHFVANSTKDPDMTDALSVYTSQKILQSIHYFRCNTCTELIALSHQLTDFIANKCSKVKAIVLDSFAFHFRHNWDDMSNRTRVMNGLAQRFIKIASAHNTARYQSEVVNSLSEVVFVNQMTTKLVGKSDSKVVPALGESWSHVATNRLLLFWQQQTRYANLFKSADRREDTVPYCITSDGIRDVDIHDSIEDEPSNKRLRH